MELKRCSSCGEEKAVSEFGLSNGKPKSQCKACLNAYMKAWRVKDPETHERDKARKREHQKEMLADPLQKAALYNQMANWRHENKDKVNEQSRVRKQKRMLDPAKHEMDLQTKREYREDPEHRAKDLVYAKDKHKERQTFINDMKRVPCVDCGNLFPPVCMDFDHVNGEKVANISEMKTYTMERIKEEIAKCDIVCANCHRIRTFQRRGSDESLTTLKPILIGLDSVQLHPAL